MLNISFRCLGVRRKQNWVYKWHSSLDFFLSLSLSPPAVLSLFLPFFVSFFGYWLGFILVRKVENVLGSDGRKYRRVVEQDFHWNFRVNSKCFFAFFSCVLGWIVFIVVLFERSPSPPPLHVRLLSTRELHIYAKRQTSDSGWEFLKIENEQIKAAQNNSYR